MSEACLRATFTELPVSLPMLNALDVSGKKGIRKATNHILVLRVMTAFFEE
jgi:hypothetical protein